VPRIGGARDVLGVSTGVCAEARIDGRMKTNEQKDTLLLVSCISLLGQLYVFNDTAHNFERTCTDNYVLE
jgi:hypothetical protein